MVERIRFYSVTNKVMDMYKGGFLGFLTPSFILSYLVGHTIYVEQSNTRLVDSPGFLFSAFL